MDRAMILAALVTVALGAAKAAAIQAFNPRTDRLGLWLLLERVVAVLVFACAMMVMSGCNSDLYAGAHSGTSIADSVLIWDRMPPIDGDWFWNPWGSLNTALDPTVWRGHEVESGW